MFYHNYYRVITKHCYKYNILQCPQNHTHENKTKQNNIIPQYSRPQIIENTINNT